MLAAGVDVGNSTTELAVARLEPGRQPEPLLWLMRPTTGPKGSAGCADAVADLLERAERRLGERPHRLLVAELHPVETGLVELGRTEAESLGAAAIARPASATPSGEGAAAGILRRLPELAGEPPDGSPVIAVVLDEDFEEAARLLREAAARGWRIAGAVVRGDDGVLIGNRFERSVPIVDEVADAAELPLGARAAIEVAPAGSGVAELSDPLRLGVLLGLEPQDARAVRAAARALAGHRAAVAVRAPRRRGERSEPEAPAVLVARDGSERPLDERAPVPPPGSIRAIRGAAGDRDRLLDVVWCPLPGAPEDPGFTRRLAHRRATALAVLREGDSSGLLEALDALVPGGVEVVATESEAAVLGAATTPGAAREPLVADLGAGTVDLRLGDAAVETAGAGELVTRICAGLLGCGRELAERAKRRSAARVETPFVLHLEDGSRSFLGEPAPSDALGRLCVREPRALLPLDAPLAPEVWRSLRRAAKRDVLARNVRRALDAAGGLEQADLLVLVGGSASDPEVVDAVAAELADTELAVARGDVLGRYGPRAAVAVGLLLAAAR